MTVTIEVIKQGTINLLKDMESLGLIHIQSAVAQDTAKTAAESGRSWRDLYGCCEGQPGTVEDFLADCRADKERELAIEERNRRA